MYDIDAELLEYGYKFEFDYGEYGYDWTETRVYTKSNRVFALSDSGCSCNYFGEWFSEVNEAIGSMVEVISLPPLVGYTSDSSSHDFTDKDSLREAFRALGVR